MKTLRLKNNIFDYSVNLACIIQLAGIVIYLIAVWGGLPDKIPGHYNATGEIDRWGSKSELIVLPIISWLLYMMMTAVEQFPQIWNTGGVTVTEENKYRVTRILKNMIGTLKLVVVTVFTFISLNSSRGEALPVWFMPVFLVLTFAPIIFFSVKLVRAGS